jgi:hypothetical protein
MATLYTKEGYQNLGGVEEIVPFEFGIWMSSAIQVHSLGNAIGILDIADSAT